MSRVEYPAKGLGKSIRWVNDARQVSHCKDALFLPILNGKVWSIDVTGMFGGDPRVNDFDGGSIILINSCRFMLWKT